MQKDNKPIAKQVKESIDRLLHGAKMDPDSIQLLNKWYEELKDEEQYKEDLPADLGEKILRKIKFTIQSEQKLNTTRKKYRLDIPHYKKASWIRAAVILAFVGSTALALHLSHRSPQQQEVTVQSLISHSNPAGQKSKVKLPDGSSVYLNAASEISYTSGFGEHHRELKLDGEAYFEVAKDSLPFRVTSHGLITQAVGTAFNINGYEAQQTQVQLVEGIVKVFETSNPPNVYTLLPGKGLRKDGNSKVQLFDFDLMEATAWTEGTILLDQSPLEETLKLLERWYGVKILVSAAPKRELAFSGEFHQAMLSDLLESLAYSYRFEYEIDQKHITIKFL
ncbi:anti-sigma factor [Echinicola pacifica]|uniref:Anti-sigma factor n=1 Tax=Echinicola pacifica TaxID=346377 RepID=A0A918PL94_9BACT|nr:FecR domain-containing protein [Echinicola pacifica]GGZ12741.1 anti-sigma factor [Echinicola pacifica]